MNKSTIVILIVAGAMVLFGAGLFAGAMTVASWNFSVLSIGEFVNNTYVVTEDFTNISITSGTADIKFVPSTDGQCRVECGDMNYIEYKTEVLDGTLHITETDAREWFQKISISFVPYSSEITVYLPEGAYGTLTIKEDTGDIEIPADFSFESIDMQLSTGDVSSSADTAGLCKITASTGEVTVLNASVGALELKTSTGKITVSDVACTQDVSVNVSTGKTFLTNLTCLDLTSTGTTGDMKLTNVIASGSLEIKRSTGDVTFEGSDAATITVKTDTGEVEGTLRSDKIFVYKTNTGDVVLPKTTTGGICDITTNTGDIILSIQ